MLGNSAMYRLLVLVCTFAVALGFGDRARAGEQAERDAIKKQVIDLFQSGDLAALDELARGYAAGERTDSGIWKLSVLESGVHEAMTHDPRDTEYWAALEQRLVQWAMQSPVSAQAQLARVRMYLTRAVGFQSTGFGVKGSWSDYPPVIEQVQAARTHLEAHPELATIDPRWDEMMLEVARVQNWPYSEWSAQVDAALDRHPTYYTLYFHALNHKSSRNPVAIETIVRDAVARTQATDGIGLYVRLYWWIYSSVHHEQLFEESDADWPTMRAAIDDVLKDYPNQWNINHFAKFACLADDAEKALELGALITEFDASVWRSRQEFDDCQSTAKIEHRFRQFGGWWTIGSIGVLAVVGLAVRRWRRSRRANTTSV